MPLLVCGGDADPNLRRLLDRARQRKIKLAALLTGSATHPVVRWDLDDDRLSVDGRRLAPGAAFIRYDVFTNLADQRPQSAHRANCWYTMMASWIDAHPGVRAFNRRFGGQIQKPHLLHAARRHGLSIPRTYLTNDVPFLQRTQARGPLVVKPIIGGDYCQELGPLLAQVPHREGAAAAPAIVQERLVPPEVRVYRLGDRFSAFQVKADALDYRTTQNVQVEPFSGLDPSILDGLRRLTDELGLDFMAADFKACPRTGRLLFLEVNSAPMFAAFDQAANGALCDAMLDFLADR